MSMINLLPEDYIYRRSQRRANMMCIVLFGVVMAGIFGAAIVSEQTLRNTEKVRNHVNADYARAAELLGKMQHLEAEKRQSIRKATATASLLERAPRSYLLATITQAMPEHTSLTELSLKATRKAAAKPKPPTSKFQAVKGLNQQPEAPRTIMILEVTGLAATDLHVARFIAALLRNPLFQSVELDYSQEKKLRAKNNEQEDLHIREFRVKMELRPDVDVIDLIQPEEGKAGDLAATAVEDAPESPKDVEDVKS